MIHFLWPCQQRFLLGKGERRQRGAEHPVRSRRDDREIGRDRL